MTESLHPADDFGKFDIWVARFASVLCKWVIYFTHRCLYVFPIIFLLCRHFYTKYFGLLYSIYIVSTHSNRLLQKFTKHRQLLEWCANSKARSDSKQKWNTTVQLASLVVREVPGLCISHVMLTMIKSLHSTAIEEYAWWLLTIA